MPRKWTDLRRELEKAAGLTKSQLDRELRKLTRDGKLDPMQKDTGGGNARLVSDKDEATIRERVVELKVNPPKVPDQLKRGREAAAARKIETESAGGNGSAAEGDREDQNLSARSLAESPGPRNTRKSKLDRDREAVEAEGEDWVSQEEAKKGKKSLVKWLIIGGVAVAGVLALMAWMRRRQAAAGGIAASGGGYAPQPAAPGFDAPQPAPGEDVATLAAQYHVSPAEYLQLRAMGQVP